MSGSGPEYLESHLIAASSVEGRSHLRSANQGNLFVPRTRTKIGERCFKSSGSRVWNSFPTGLRSTELTDARFASELKTYLFT